MFLFLFFFFFLFFFKDTATTEIYTLHIVGSVRMCIRDRLRASKHPGPGKRWGVGQATDKHPDLYKVYIYRMIYDIMEMFCS